MFRLSHTAKLIGVMTMSALLLWLPTMPAVSQKGPEPPQPPPVILPVIPPRPQTVQQADGALATLTAAMPLLLDVGNMAFASHTIGNLAWIPIDLREWTEDKLQLLEEIFKGNTGSVTVGVFAAGDNLVVYHPSRPDDTFTLPAGTYLVKVQWNEQHKKAMGALFDQEGNLVAWAKLLTAEMEMEEEWLANAPFVYTKQQGGTNRFLVAIGSEPLSKIIPEIEEVFNTPSNPIIVVVVIKIKVAKVVVAACAGAVAGAIAGGR